MKIDSFYDDFDEWVDSNYAPEASSLFINLREHPIETRREYWLIAVGLDETSWFVYCQQYDAKMLEND